MTWLQVAVWIGLIAIILRLAAAYPNLPAKIPSHFGFLGNADQWGARPLIWLLPTIMVVETIVITMVGAQRSPTGRAVLNLLNLELVILFGYIVRGQVRVATGAQPRLGNFIWVILIALIATVLILGRKI